MSITGLQSGAFQTMLAEMRKDIAAAQTQGVSDVMAAKDAATKDIKTTIAGVKEKIKSEVSDALQEFAQFTNGPQTEDTKLPPVNIISDKPRIDTGLVEHITLQNGETA